MECDDCSVWLRWFGLWFCCCWWFPCECEWGCGCDEFGGVEMYSWLFELEWWWWWWWWCDCDCECGCCFSSCLISNGLKSGWAAVDKSSMYCSLSFASNFTCVATAPPNIIAFSGSIFWMELVISSHSGGRMYDSSAVALDMHTYSLCTFAFAADVASGEYLASKLYGFVESASGYDDSALLKLHSLP